MNTRTTNPAVTTTAEPGMLEKWKLESQRLIPLLRSFADRLQNHARSGLVHPELYEADHDELMATLRHLEQMVSAEPEAQAASPTEPELVKHPSHYNRGGIECMDAAEAMTIGWSPQTAYRLGQAYQYIYRHNDKGGPRDAIRDLEKSVFWIQREIDARKAALKGMTS